MELIIGTITVFIIGVILTIIGKLLKKKKIMVAGICTILLLIIAIIIFIIYAIEKNDVF